MDWKIPRTPDDELPISLNDGDRLFIVGANGSGKSALIQHLVSSAPNEKIKRISAHRQTWLTSGDIALTAKRRKELDPEFTQREVRPNARWMDTYAEEKQSAVLFDLVAQENDRNQDIARRVDDQNPDEATKISLERKAPFDQLNSLLALGTLSVSLSHSKAGEILAQRRDTNTSFSIAQMSDGERNAAIIAATVLTVEPGTVLLIDEPERHLHRAIIEPFLSALFEQRADCTFVVSTHEIALPVANPEACVLMVRSCKWDNNKTTAWDVEVLEANADLPEELKLAILGSRERILFVEGKSDSLDLPLYKALFPGVSVVPKGNCDDVQKAVSGLRGSQNLSHVHVKAFGLIDRDDRTEKEIEQLAQKHVFTLDAYSVEALYYCSDAIAAIAHWQKEALGCDADQMIRVATEKALDALNQDGLTERMALHKCERRMDNLLLSQRPNWEEIKTSPTLKITVCVDSPYPTELKHFKDLVDDKKLDDLVARYPLRKSKVFDAIAEALKCSRNLYPRMVIARVQSDKALAQRLKERVGRLSQVLEAEPSENAGL